MTKPTRADMVRESVMHKERTRAKPSEGERRTQFEQVLKERAQQLQQPSLIRQAVTQQATQQAARQVKREEDRGRDRERSRDEGKERESRRGAEGERRTDAKEAQQRVVAKHGVKDEGGGRGGAGGRGGFEGRRKAAAQRAKLPSGKEAPSMLKAQFAKRLSAALRYPTRAMTQRVLNQIVNYVRILVNSDEEKEIRIELHEKLFKGLRLRVVSKGKGKVAVHFATADSAVRQIFEHNKGRIENALARKGIEVAEISVT